MKTSIILTALLLTGLAKANVNPTSEPVRKCKFFIENEYVLSEIYSKIKSNKIELVAHQSDADYNVNIYAFSWSSTCTVLGAVYFSCKDHKAGYELTNFKTGRVVSEKKFGAKNFNGMADKAITQMKKLKCLND